MKTLLMILMFLGMANFAVAQEKIDSMKNEGLKAEELPEVVIKNAGKDFSVYLPDKNPDRSVKSLQQQFIAYDLGKDYEGFSNYLVILEGQKGTLSATYNENGKLTRVVEDYKNVMLPSKVIYAVYKEFPGWDFVNDKFLYTQEDGDIVKKQYHIKIKKDNEVRKLVVRPDGEFITGLATR